MSHPLLSQRLPCRPSVCLLNTSETQQTAGAMLLGAGAAQGSSPTSTSPPARAVHRYPPPWRECSAWSPQSVRRRGHEGNSRPSARARTRTCAHVHARTCTQEGGAPPGLRPAPVRPQPAALTAALHLLCCFSRPQQCKETPPQHSYYGLVPEGQFQSCSRWSRRHVTSATRCCPASGDFKIQDKSQRRRWPRPS